MSDSNNEGWIKILRKLLRWEWYQDSHMVHFFLHLLLLANHKDSKWRGIVVKRGQLVTGRRSLSKATGISQRSIRTCLKRLKTTHEVTIKATNRYSIITVCNYDEYQDKEISSDPQNAQPTANKRPASDHKQECKEVKKESLLCNFDNFYRAYPKKKAKEAAKKAWLKLKPDPELEAIILTALDAQKNSDEWLRDNGQYIPMPSTWLNNRRWEDEPPDQQQQFEPITEKEAQARKKAQEQAKRHVRA